MISDVVPSITATRFPFSSPREEIEESMLLTVKAEAICKRGGSCGARQGWGLRGATWRVANNRATYRSCKEREDEHTQHHPEHGHHASDLRLGDHIAVPLCGWEGVNDGASGHGSLGDVPTVARRIPRCQ